MRIIRVSTFHRQFRTAHSRDTDDRQDIIVIWSGDSSSVPGCHSRRSLLASAVTEPSNSPNIGSTTQSYVRRAYRNGRLQQLQGQADYIPFLDTHQGGGSTRLKARAVQSTFLYSHAQHSNTRLKARARSLEELKQFTHHR